MTMNDVYEISTPNGDIKEIEIDGKTAWERAVNETKTGATPIIANATRGGNASAYQIYGNTPYQEWAPSPDNPCEVKGVGERTANLFDISSIIGGGRADNTNSANTIFGYVRENKYVNNYGFYGEATALKGQLFDIKAGQTITISCDVLISSNYIYDTDTIYIGIIKYDGTKRYHVTTSGVAKNVLTAMSKTLTVPEDGLYCLELAQYGAQSMYRNLQCEFSNIMLNEGSEPLSYEPYGYKTTVVDSGKNLIDKSRLLKGYFYRNTTNIVFYSSESSLHRYIGININKINNYTINLTPKENGFIRIYETDDSGKITDIITDQKDITIGENVVISRTKKPLTTTIYIQTTVNNWDNLQLEEGTTATPYTPYRPPIEATIYHDEPYFTNDYVRKDKDGGVEHRKWVKHIVNINSTVELSNGLMCGISRFLGSDFYSDPVMRVQSKSDKLPYGSTTPNHFYVNTVNTVLIGNNDDTLATLQNKFNGVIIYYPLATPTDTPKELPDILLVNNYNGFDADTEIKPEKISVTYLGKDGN